MRVWRPFTLSGLSVYCLSLFLAGGCGGSYDDTIAGVTVPVPKEMTRSSDKPAEVSLLGFAAGQATFHGDMSTDKIVEFYKTEMPERGWRPNMNLQSSGAVLAYSKEGKSLLVSVGKESGKTSLTLTVGGAGG